MTSVNAVPESTPTHFQSPLRVGSEIGGVLEVTNGGATYSRIEANEFKAPALDDDEGGKLFVGIGEIWLRRAGRFEICRTFTLAIATLPNEVGAVLATAELALVLDDEWPQSMIRNGTSHLVNRVGAHVRCD